jgi:hypothetical protein
LVVILNEWYKFLSKMNQFNSKTTLNIQITNPHMNMCTTNTVARALELFRVVSFHHSPTHTHTNKHLSLYRRNNMAIDVRYAYTHCDEHAPHHWLQREAFSGGVHLGLSSVAVFPFTQNERSGKK